MQRLKEDKWYLIFILPAIVSLFVFCLFLFLCIYLCLLLLLTVMSLSIPGYQYLSLQTNDSS